ncbi:SusC/RagA family TonB-linked outer membrane protein [Sphingobacterium sp. C459-1T]|uniref:SusC/RagA family TonB-linked outer membrane protein n=2 Tax=Sphingobacterium faecale TaxID=2803775 RepID=A0ABS1R950_9SPHI|nr:SusC/RagA family TonB-linked outer membrane protein [Sphingobacterium faecale]
MTKLTLLFILFFALNSWASVSAQKLSFSNRKVDFKTAIEEIQRQSDYSFSIKDKHLRSAVMVNLSGRDLSLEEALQLAFKNQPFGYKLGGKIIVSVDQIPEKATPKNIKNNESSAISTVVQQRIVRGKVVNEYGEEMAGVSVFVKPAQHTVTTDAKGEYGFISKNKVDSIYFSYVGYQKIGMVFPMGELLNVRMKPLVEKVEDVVVTGIYSRDKQSFTGSYSSFSGEELKQIGVQNVIQSLRTLDPAFNLLENTQFGSDPNRLPDLEIRGKSSIVGLKEQFGEDPNQPLFILDGFETSLQTIMDLSMDRIASATILKDATSTAIYGSKAANGVVVIETKSPARGEVRVSYNNSTDLTFADLNDYNLMNAAEKLEFELRAGRFKSNLSTVEEDNSYRYYHLVQELKRGVDTDWLSEPLRTGVNQRNNLYLEGGDRVMRYGIGVSHNAIQGVMKNSKRKNLSGNVDLIYRKGKFSLMNKLSIDQMDNQNPIVEFSAYSRANPYYRKYNDKGGVDKWLETFNMTTANGRVQPVGNPLWDDALNSKNTGGNLGFRNNLNLEYRPDNYFNIRGRLSLSKSNAETEEFYSPDATRFEGMEALRKGSYRNSSTVSTSYQGDISGTYGRMFAHRHQINVVFGGNINESSSVSKGFDAEGFPEGDFTTPAFSNGYPNGGKPSYRDAKRRNVGYFVNTGYSFDNRYLFDFNLRSDGTSVFGSNRLFSTTWSAGAAWNIHREKFLEKYADDISMFKIRASVGNPGNQNFGTFNAITTYQFNNWLQNNFGTGLIIDQFGDPNLEWQKTLDKNIGLDLSILNNRFHVTFDYYNKKTDPLLANVGIPLSVGIQNRLMNVGMQMDKGYSGTVKYAIFYKPQEQINWTTSFTFRSGRSEYDNIGNKLDAFNRENLTKNMTRFYNGASPDDLWSVISKGIDPASGMEIFQNRNGENVFAYSYNDEVVVGNGRPKLEGVFGNTFFWKGFSANVHIRYSYGSDAFNSTLYSKVENISSTSINMNQDKRALYDRWKEVGDVAQYKGISLSDPSPMSSRFVQKNNYLSIESIRAGYEFRGNWMRSLALSRLMINAYMNDILRVSSMGNERGIDYPFARTVTFGLSANF